MDISEQSQLDMYIQQVITHGRTEDIRALFKNVTLDKFKTALNRLRHFLPFEVGKFWEDFLGIAK